MADTQHTIVVDANGNRGLLTNRTSDPEHVVIDLGDGDCRRVPRTALRPQPDLTIRVDGALTDFEALPIHPMHLAMRNAEIQEVEIGPDERRVIPVHQEQVRVDTRDVETGRVRVHKTVQESEHVVQTPTVVEEVEVERVPIGRIVTDVPAARQEGDTTVLPVLEEVLVVEKRLVLKEEVRITKVKRTVPNEQRVTVRKEQVEVHRISSDGTETPG